MNEGSRYRPFTPLLLVVLFASALFAAICYAANHELITLRAAQIVAVAAVALGAGHRLLLTRV